MSGFWSRLSGRRSAPPPMADHFVIIPIDDPEVTPEPSDRFEDLQAISAFGCVIEYAGEQRYIVCKRYDVIGEIGYVGAVCHTASGYRQFRTDRITTVADAYTGEVLGDGSYFWRFAPESVRERVSSWGLSPSRRALLVAGLNVLAFMARCDGQWHPLETGSIERFVVSMWLRREWPGDPPIGEIVAHAQRLSPDADGFFRSLRIYALSAPARAILMRAVHDLIMADGMVHKAEHDWVIEMADFMDDWRSAGGRAGNDDAMPDHLAAMIVREF